VTHEVWLVGPIRLGDVSAGKSRRTSRSREKDEAVDQGRADVDRRPTARRSRKPLPVGGPTVGRKTSRPWVRTSTLVSGAPVRRSDIPAGSWIKDEGERGIARLRRRPRSCTRNERSQSQSRSFSETPEGLNTIVAYLQAGSTEFAVRYGRNPIGVPTLEIENAPASIFPRRWGTANIADDRGVARAIAAGGFRHLGAARLGPRRNGREGARYGMKPTRSISPRTAITA